MALQADNNTLALAVQDLRSTLTAQQKGIDNMNWQLEQKTKQVRGLVGGSSRNQGFIFLPTLYLVNKAY